MDKIKGFTLTSTGIDILDTEDKIFNQFFNKSYNDPLRSWVTRYLDFEGQYSNLLKDKATGLETAKVAPQALAPNPLSMKTGAGKYFKSASKQEQGPPPKQLRGLKYIKF